MFIYLSKKIAIPSGAKLSCVSWNSEQGWIACGGEGGMLKVLKLEAPKGGKVRGLAASGTLSMNQSLEGHDGAVQVITWNEAYRKLTTADQYGLITVWILYKGFWYEEMINNRNKSVVRGMRWSGDGQKICIVYEDGAVIMGSVEGRRKWGLDLPVGLSAIEWAPDGLAVLFGTVAGEVHVYDANGSFLSQVPVYCMNGLSAGSAQLVGIRWYNGSGGYQEADVPTLAICFTNGRMQIMSNMDDSDPVLIDTGLNVTCLDWNHQGSVLAVAGVPAAQDAPAAGSKARVQSAVQFYTPHGQHLRTLKVPGSGVKSLTWEGSGLRLSLAVDHYVYFANVRQEYKWARFGKSTLCYAFQKPEKSDLSVCFWDTARGESSVKQVKRLLCIRSAGDHCTLACRTDPGCEEGPFVLILCNEIGQPIDNQYLLFEPTLVTMNRQCVIAANDETIYVWRYKKRLSDGAGLFFDSAAEQLRDATQAGAGEPPKETIFHVDDIPSSADVVSGSAQARRAKLTRSTTDPVCAITCNDQVLVVGRVSGTIQKYSLPTVSLDNKYTLRSRPQLLALNCNSTRMSIIDIGGIMSFFDFNAGGNGEHLALERKDVWDMLWSDDNPQLMAMMEKTRMYVMRGLDPEEPVTSSAYIARFSDLEIEAVYLDDLMTQPTKPSTDLLVKYEARSLRDARAILENVGLRDAYLFVEDNPHARLWRLVADHALRALDFTVAEQAFVHAADYQGICLVKRLRAMDDPRKQQAEVATYFHRFDEAEGIYHRIDRRDLAVDLRMQLGDWFRAEQLVQSSSSSDDSRMRSVWAAIGGYYKDHQVWSKAQTYYSRAQDYSALVDAMLMREDFSGLREMTLSLPEGHVLLRTLGEAFQSYGIHSDAVAAYLKAGEVRRAIECCVELNQWDKAVSLAEVNKFTDIATLLSNYANHLLQKDDVLPAIELYRKANQHNESAKLLVQLADKAAGAGLPMRAKKLHTLAALDTDTYRDRLRSQEASGVGGATAGLASTDRILASVLHEDSSLAKADVIDKPWHAAEAYHFLCLVQRQLYDGAYGAAMLTALRLCEYEDVLPEVEIYSLLALAAYYNKHFAVASRAMAKLEACSSLSEEKQQQFQDLALGIFIRSAPRDPDARYVQCCNNTCAASIEASRARCSQCETVQPVCYVTGAPMHELQVWTCPRCRHPSSRRAMAGRTACPLCHADARAQSDY